MICLVLAAACVRVSAVAPVPAQPSASPTAAVPSAPVTAPDPASPADQSGSVTSSVTPPATAPASAAAEPGPACAGYAGYVEVTRKGRTERLTAACGPGRPSFAYAEILEKQDGSPYFILEACNGVAPDTIRVDPKQTIFAIDGPVRRLPGALATMRLVMHESDSERTAIRSNVRIERFGDAGEIVEGEFTATLNAGLNEDPQPIRGRFSVCRKLNRRSP